MKEIILNSSQYKLNLLLYVSLAILIPFSFLFSPPPQREFCGQYVSLVNNVAGFAVNCDSGTFIEVAEKPQLLFEEGQIRQNRPLMPLLGRSPSIPPYIILLRLLGLNGHIPRVYLRVDYYLAFILINFSILFAALLLYNQILVYWKVDELIRWASSIFLVGNSIVKAFFWTPHQQMLNIFTPIFIVFLFYIGLTRKYVKTELQWNCLSLTLGFLPLGYGTAILVLPALLIARLSSTSQTENAYSLLQKITPFLKSLLLFLLPGLLWVALVNLLTGSFYSHETEEYRQFVWVLDAWQAGELREKVLSVFGTYRHALFLHQSAYYLVAFQIGILVLFALLRGIRGMFNFILEAKYLYLTFALFLFFIYFINFYPGRILFNFFILLLILNLAAFSRLVQNNRYATFCMAGFILVLSLQNYWQVLTQVGPFD